MALTVNLKNFKAVNRQRCIRTSDIKSVTELAQSMNSAGSEYELLRIARQMLYQNVRNYKAQCNEHNVRLFRNALIDSTRPGDSLTTESACELINESDIDRQGARYYAILAALDDLTNDGYFKREYFAKKSRRGTSRICVYIVR